MEQVIATDSEALRKAFLAAPENPAEWENWRTRIRTWAEEQRARLPSPLYDLEAQSWASRCYSQGFLMLWDHELIDHATGAWKVDAVLDRAERDFGGYDLVVLWNNYPLSGVDDRHQMAYFDLLPGGRPALRRAVARFHERGVRVLVDHKPWVPGMPPGYTSVEEAFADLVRECDLDGIYLDCSDGPDDAFRTLLAEKAGKHRIFVSEAPARLEPFGHEIGSWQQMTDDSAAPGTYRNRWLDRNHLTWECRRYFHDPIRELQRGWMNGGGFVIWENVFGYWADYSPRCRSWMRLLFPAQRRFADWFIKGEWEPLTDGSSHRGLFLSRWTLDGQALYTAVNRRGHALEKSLLRLPSAPGCRWVDLISGAELAVLEDSAGMTSLGGILARDGLAGFMAIPEANPDSGMEEFLHQQRMRFASADWEVRPWPGEHRRTPLQHVLRRVIPTARQPEVPPGMIRVPDYEGWMVTRYRMRECGYIAGAVDEKHVYDGIHRTQPYSRQAVVRAVALDRQPVTNSDYHRFLQASGYRPHDPRNFLQHWVDGRPAPGREKHPVVYVSRTDAEAYARWAGKRLPTEEEWQRAAAGPEGRAWPWGAEFDPARCNHASSGTTPVDAFPSGCTPDGFWDLSGNVWEMTAGERSDGHTRYQILRGGSWFHSSNSGWLFDTGAQAADWGAKHILLCDAWDRCSTVGFRCAVDLSRP